MIDLKTMKVLAAILMSAMIVLTTHAETRAWTDNTGRTLAADFISMDESSITVRTEAGKVVVLKKDTLADGEWAAAEKIRATLIDPTNREGTKLEDPTKPWMSAKTSSSSREETVTWSTSWGSYNKTIDQERVVEVSLRSRSDSPSRVIMEVIWLTNGSAGKGNPTGVSAVSRVDVELKPREVLTRKGPLSFSVEKQRYVALGTSFQRGGGYAGWVARLVDPANKTVICQTASMVPYLKWSAKVPVYVK